MSQPGLQSEGYLTSIPSRDNNQRTLCIVSPIWKICWLLWILRIPSRPLLSRRNLWCTLPVNQNLDWFSILSDSVDITLKSFDALFLPLVTIQKKKKNAVQPCPTQFHLLYASVSHYCHMLAPHLSPDKFFSGFHTKLFPFPLIFRVPTRV